MQKKDIKDEQSLPKQSNKKIFLQGTITNVNNPKVALFFLAFLPQFIHTNSGVSTPTPFIILGLTFALTGGMWSLIITYFSSMVTRKLRGNSKVYTVLNKLTGIVFMGRGIKLLQTKPTS